MARGQALDASASGHNSGRRARRATAGPPAPSHPGRGPPPPADCIPGLRTNQLVVATFFCPRQPPGGSPAAPAAQAPPPPRRPRPRPRLPSASQDALRGPGRKSASSRVCASVCLCLEAARGPGQTPGNPVGGVAAAPPPPTEPLAERSRPGPSPGREDVAPVHQGR
ncbi:hypothetical protein VULLAG_LOCUS11399 [Vulpes lagopus]